MSRSYKKHSYCGDTTHKKESRTIANRRLRRNHKYELYQNKSYRKLYQSYDICDYYSCYSWEEWWDSCLDRYRWLCFMRPGYEAEHAPPDAKDEYRRWYKWYKGK